MAPGGGARGSAVGAAGSPGPLAGAAAAAGGVSTGAAAGGGAGAGAAAAGGGAALGAGAADGGGAVVTGGAEADGGGGSDGAAIADCSTSANAIASALELTRNFRARVGIIRPAQSASGFRGPPGDRDGRPRRPTHPGLRLAIDAEVAGRVTEFPRARVPHAGRRSAHRSMEHLRFAPRPRIERPRTAPLNPTFDCDTRPRKADPPRCLRSGTLRRGRGPVCTGGARTGPLASFFAPRIRLGRMVRAASRRSLPPASGGLGDRDSLLIRGRMVRAALRRSLPPASVVRPASASDHFFG